MSKQQAIITRVLKRHIENIRGTRLDMIFLGGNKEHQALRVEGLDRMLKDTKKYIGMLWALGD
jgi:hypothetical protein